MKLEVLRIIDDSGNVIHPERAPSITTDGLQRMYRTLILLRVLDERMLRLQRQGRLGFYMTSTGEEATQVGPLYALRPTDWIFSSYREVGAAFYRGYPLREYLCQMFGNAEDPVRGRQMPVHHAVRRINFVSVSSPVGTQIPHAVGMAWAAKLQGKDDVAFTYFGDGATSTGPFHVAANMAGVFKLPCILFCRNNGWAISVPRSVQTASKTFAQKAVAYGITPMLVDGNDVLALVAATQEAAARARRGEGATLIEAWTYRRGAHSSSDDPSVYRDPGEPKEWESHDPVERYRRYLVKQGLLTDAADAQLREELTHEVMSTLKEVEAVTPKPPLPTLFEDVYADVPWHLREQQRELEQTIERHGPVASQH